MSDGNDITLNGEKVTKDQLQKAKENLSKSERIVEVKENEFRKLTRMKE